MSAAHGDGDEEIGFETYQQEFKLERERVATTLQEIFVQTYYMGFFSARRSEDLSQSPDEPQSVVRVIRSRFVSPAFDNLCISTERVSVCSMASTQARIGHRLVVRL